MLASFLPLLLSLLLKGTSAPPASQLCCGRGASRQAGGRLTSRRQDSRWRPRSPACSRQPLHLLGMGRGLLQLGPQVPQRLGRQGVHGALGSMAPQTWGCSVYPALPPPARP